MNKQRKVLITITYNEMGIIIDTKAEEVTRARDIDVPIKRGRWIIEPGIGCKCSACGFDIGNDLDFMEYVKYCPQCGAIMEELWE